MKFKMSNSNCSSSPQYRSVHFWHMSMGWMNEKKIIHHFRIHGWQSRRQYHYVLENVFHKLIFFFVPAKILLLICTLALVGRVLGVNDDPSQAPAICAAQGSNSILVAHEDCSKFYKCYKGVPVPLDCPKPLLYNPEKEWCDWPGNVNCNRN